MLNPTITNINRKLNKDGYVKDECGEYTLLQEFIIVCNKMEGKNCMKYIEKKLRRGSFKRILNYALHK